MLMWFHITAVQIIYEPGGRDLDRKATWIQPSFAPRLPIGGSADLAKAVDEKVGEIFEADILVVILRNDAVLAFIQVPILRRDPAFRILGHVILD